MASASNTLPSLAKKTFNISDPSPSRSRTPLFESTSKHDIPHPSSWSAPPASPSPSKPLAPKPLSPDFYDENIYQLLQRKLILQVLHGRPSDTLQFHRRKLVEQVVEWMTEDVPTDSYNTAYRDQLMTLLMSASRQNVKDLPVDESEWIKLLNQWVRNNSSDDIISERNIYQILAVDGIRGFRPKDLKHYLPAILLPVRAEYRVHAQGIRAMYEFFDDHPKLASLTGSDSACVVFLSILQFYVSNLRLVDDQVCSQIDEAKTWAEGYIQRHSHYYPDLKSVNEEIYNCLGNVYSEQFTDADDWKVVGMELLRILSVPPPTK